MFEPDGEADALWSFPPYLYTPVSKTSKWKDIYESICSSEHHICKMMLLFKL